MLDPLLPGELFVNICAKTLPDFASANEAAIESGFTQNSATGTFYNNRSNVSFKLHGDECPMVFGTDRPEDEVLRRLAMGVANLTDDPDSFPRNLTLSSRTHSDGLTYYRMGLMKN